MKILTLNFLTCARKACKASAASFPLHPTDAELEIAEAPANPLFLANMLPRLEWGALRTVCDELGLPGLADEAPEPEALWEEAEHENEGAEEKRRPTQLARDLHRLLLETTVKSGKLVCGNCGHHYAVM